MQAFLLVIHVLLAVGLIVLVLIQHGRGADAGAAFGSGASATVFGARGSASFLTKLTTLLAIGFFANSLALAYLSASQPEDASLMERVITEQPDAAPAPVVTPSDVPQDGQAATDSTPAPAENGDNGRPTDVPVAPE
jgi:preprotein translocase subunit SecG